MSSNNPPSEPEGYPHTLITPDKTIQIVLTYQPLSLTTASDHITNSSCGANVIFTGTTRDTFANHRVSRLSYSTYPALALTTLSKLATTIHQVRGLGRVYIAHRLGVVEVCESSIVVGVSAPHRQAAWTGAEALLEEIKARAEIWKREWFVTADGEEEGVWRENRLQDSRGGVIEQ